MTITLKREKIFFGNLLLVNAQHPIRHADKGELTAVFPAFPDILMRSEAAAALQRLLDSVPASRDIVPVSGYRDAAEQTAIYEGSLRDNGKDFTNRFVARPGCSEHQTGLAIDLGLNREEIDFIRPDFPRGGICGVFRQAAGDFGFVERYLKGKEKLTGIAHEPWHFRYVGWPHSKIMAQGHLVLEEYLQMLRKWRQENPLLYRPKTGGSVAIYYLPALNGETVVSLPPKAVCRISGDNVDGFIVTVWRDPHEP